MELYKKVCGVLVFRICIVCLLLIILEGCSSNSQQNEISIDMFAYDINFTKRALFAAQDSLGFEIKADLKFKESKRERRNEVQVLMPSNKVESLLRILNTQSEIKYLPIDDFEYSEDSIKVNLIIKYHK